ncbi:DUF5994 family protein [Streptomyces sp. PH10-H1]|uniref:DUF5994 family protein n=1 Tax=Streptomyces sp. PH10-H1 TaxID=3046212 RepID=UPI0032D97C63
MATSVLATRSHEGAEQTLRLQLARHGDHPGILDGAWWPHSRDLARELPVLLAVLDPLWGRITHASVHRATWPHIPGKVPAAGHILRLGWFDAEQDAHTISLLSYTVGRWDLLVVPPPRSCYLPRRRAAALSRAGRRRPARRSGAVPRG